MKLKKRFILPVIAVAGLFFGSSFFKYILQPFSPETPIPLGLNVSFLDTSLGIDAESCIQELTDQQTTPTSSQEQEEE